MAIVFILNDNVYDCRFNFHTTKMERIAFEDIEGNFGRPEVKFSFAIVDIEKSKKCLLERFLKVCAFV